MSEENKMKYEKFCASRQTRKENSPRKNRKFSCRFSVFKTFLIDVLI